MMQFTRMLICLFMSLFLLSACGDDGTDTAKQTEKMTEKAMDKAEKAMESTAETADKMMDKAQEAVDESAGQEPEYIPNDVIYQEEIYKDWPYTKAPQADAGMQDSVQQKATTAVATVEDKAEAVTAEVTDSMEEAAEAVSAAVSGKTHTINAEARVFNPDTVYIQPGDTVAWTNMTSHNTVSVEGLIPEGAEHWRSKLGENLKVKLEKEGVYAYVCEPHIGFGMVGLIIVGKPTNLEDVTNYARDNLEGPYRRIIGKLIKVES